MLAWSSGTAGAATLAPSSNNFGSQAVGTVSAPKAFTVTAQPPLDVVLPLAVSTTGDFKQTNNCPATLGFLATASCTVNVTFNPTAAGARTGTLSTTTLVVGGPTAALAGTGDNSGAGAGGNGNKCSKKKGKGKKKGKKRAAAAKKKGKKGKKCGKKKKKGKKKH
jgi:hypothetical protein